jgi:Fe-S cluster biogenesis protein NfuA
MNQQLITPSVKEIDDVMNVIRPAMQADGGGVEVVDVKDGVVSVRLCGTCIACPSKGMTLKFGIEKTLKDRLPWVRQVVRVE